MARKPKTHITYIKAALRRIWGWYPERKKAKQRAIVGYKGKVEVFRCEECDTTPLLRKQVQIDHIEEVDNPEGWDSWDLYIERLFCPASGLKILCLPCHKEKTTANNATRRANKKKNGAL